STKKLAPMYDNPSCIGIEEKHFLVSDIDPSGSIWTKKSNSPKTQDYIEEFINLGYRDIVLQFCNRVKSQSANILNLIQGAELSSERKNALIRLIEKRMKVLNNAK